MGAIDINKKNKFNKIKIISLIFSFILVTMLSFKVDNFGFNIFNDQYITISQEQPYKPETDGFKILSIYKGDELVDVDDLELYGWSKSEITRNGYPIESDGYIPNNEIRIKADKSLLSNNLKVRFAAGPQYTNGYIKYQDNKYIKLGASRRQNVLEQRLRYSSWISIISQYVLMIAAGLFLSMFLTDIFTTFASLEEKSIKSFLGLVKPYRSNIIIFLLGSLGFYILNDFMLQGSSLSLFDATMTKNDIFIFIAYVFAISLGVRSLTINEYKHIDKLTWFIFIINPIVSFLILESGYNPNLSSMQPIYVLINSFILLLIQLLVYFITRYKRPSMIVVLVISLAFGLSNDFLMILRDSPLIPAFLGSLGVAANVASNTVIEFNGMAISAFALGIMWLMILKSVKPGKIEITKKRYLVGLGSFTAVLAVSIIVSANFFLNQVTVGVNLWRPSRTYYVEGAPYSFYRITVKQLITAPEGYDQNNVENVLDSYYYGEKALADSSSLSDDENMDLKETEMTAEESANEAMISQNEKNEDLLAKNDKQLEQKPNIIMIQSESLADYYNIGNLKLTRDPLEYTRSLSENTIQGYTYMSVVGGGTVNSEFETLTSLPLSFFPAGAYPFQQYVKNGHTSIGRLLENQGYDTWISHPNKPTNYSRQEVWPHLGFENTGFINDFSGAKYVHSYVSDETAYGKIIEQFENKGDNPLFTYLVTMQNHGAYIGSYKDGDIDIKGHEGLNPSAREYLNLVNLSDKDFKYLVNYFEKFDEPTIIAIFGDHQPSLYDYFLDIAYGENNYTDQEIFKTPLTIWANYDIEEEEDVHISLNYLAPYLFDKAGGVEMSAYQKYLLEMMEDYPVLTTKFMLDKDGNEIRNDQDFVEKNNELNSLVYYQVKDQDPTNKYFNYPAQGED